MEEIKAQLKYFSDLLDEGFDFRKVITEDKITYYVIDEDGLPIMDLGIFKHE